MNRNIFVCIAFILMLTCCANKEEVNAPYIEVSFFTNLASRVFPVMMDFNDMEKCSSGSINDSTYITLEEYYAIKSELLSLSTEDTIPMFDSRFMITLDTLKICIDYWGERWCDGNGRMGRFDPQLFYRIKCLSNYYNFSTPMDIENDWHVMKYGKPINYNFIGFEDDVKKRPIGFAKVKLLPK